MKYAYFAVSFHWSFQKDIRFKWKGNLYQFLCFCFGLSSAPRVFTKLKKIPIRIMQKLNVRLITFLEDILIIASTKNELIQARGTLIFLFQTLGFLINKNKLMLHPCQILQLLAVKKMSENEMHSRKWVHHHYPRKERTKLSHNVKPLFSNSYPKERSASIRELTQV